MFYVFKKLLVLPVITVIINIFFLLLLFYLSDIINDINFYFTNGLVLWQIVSSKFVIDWIVAGGENVRLSSSTCIIGWVT